MKWARFSKFSAYARAESHLVQQTSYGAVVTICGCLLALVLFSAELQQHLQPHIEQHMAVDGTRDKYLRFTFDMTFPALPCPVLSMDAKDASGEQTSDYSVAKNGVVHKFRLNREGQQIGLSEYITARPEGFFLRKPRKEVDNMNTAVEAHEGCHIYGWLDVQRVAGSLHISVHVDDYMMLAKTQQDIHDALEKQVRDTGHMGGMIQFPSDPSVVNVSHTIKTVSFGPTFPRQINPLNGLHRIVDHHAGTFKYFMKIVPTVYKPLIGRQTETNQYSVTEYWTSNPTGDMSLPSVWFIYDMSPISVSIEVKRRSILHLLVRFCAVVGGGFAITGMVDRLVHKLVKSIIPEQKGIA